MVAKCIPGEVEPKDVLATVALPGSHTRNTFKLWLPYRWFMCLRRGNTASASAPWATCGLGGMDRQDNSGTRPALPHRFHSAFRHSA